MANAPNREGEDDEKPVVKFCVTDRGKGTTHQIGTSNVMITGFEGTFRTDSTVSRPSTSGYNRDNAEYSLDLQGEGCTVQTGHTNVMYHIKTQPGPDLQKKPQHMQDDLKHPIQESEQQDEKARKHSEHTQETRCEQEEEDQETSYKAREDTFSLEENSTIIKDIHELHSNIDNEESSMVQSDEASTSDEELSDSYNQPEVQGTLRVTEGAAQSPVNSQEEVIKSRQKTAKDEVQNNTNKSTSKSVKAGTLDKTEGAVSRCLKTRQQIVFREIRGNYVPQQSQPVVDIHADDQILEFLTDTGHPNVATTALRVSWAGIDSSKHKTVWTISGASRKTVFTQLLKEVMGNLRRLILLLFEKYQAQLHEVRTTEDIVLIFHHGDDSSALKVVESKEDICKVLVSLMLDKEHHGNFKLDISLQDDFSSRRERSADTPGPRASGQQDVRPKQLNPSVEKVKETVRKTNEEDPNEGSASTVWQWQDDDESWINYDESQSAKLEKEHISSKTCLIKKGSKGFRVDFTTMKETNTAERGFPKRKVRRVVEGNAK